MKNLFSKKTAGLALFASIAIMASTNALACHSYDIPCKIKAAADKAKAAVEKAAADAKALADKAAADAVAAEKAAAGAAATSVGYADAAAAQAKGYTTAALMTAYHAQATAAGFANLAAADTASTAMGFASYMDRMAKDSKPFVAGELSSLQKNMTSVYKSGLSDAQTAYAQSQAGLKQFLSVSTNLLNYMKQQCESQGVQNNFGAITPYVKKFSNLSPASQSALIRIIRTITRGSPVDQQVAADMRVIGKEVGLISQNGVSLIGNAFQSNWGISIGASGGSNGLGGNTSIGFSIDTYPQSNGRYNMALTTSAGASATFGTADLGPGGSIDFSLGWGPGSSTGAEGTTWGVGGTVAGIDVALTWTVPGSLMQMFITGQPAITPQNLGMAILQGPMNQIKALCAGPGISAGVGVSVGAEAGPNISLNPGYTHVLKTWQF